MAVIPALKKKKGYQETKDNRDESNET